MDEAAGRIPCGGAGLCGVSFPCTLFFGGDYQFAGGDFDRFHCLCIGKALMPTSCPLAVLRLPLAR